MKTLSSFLTLIPLVLAQSAPAAISIDTADFAYTQDFSSLPATGTTFSWTNNSTLPGWYRDYWAASPEVEPPFRDVSVQTTGAVNSGVASQDGFINIGAEASSDRTLVLRRAFSFHGAFGAVFRNDSGATLQNFSVGYTGEQWRRHGDGIATSLYFEYAVMASVDGLDIDSDPEGWTRVNALEFVSPNIIGGNSGLNGKLGMQRTVLAPTAFSAVVPVGHYLVIRWYQDRSASDGTLNSTARHALGVDSMSLAVDAAPPALAIAIDSTDFTYSQDFSSLPATGFQFPWTNNATLPGWYRDYSGTISAPGRDASVQTDGTQASGVTSSDDGFLNVGDFDSTDRALVMRRVGSVFGAFGAAFRNETGTSLSGVSVSYTGEQWRRHGEGIATSLYFEYAVLPFISGLNIMSSPANWTRVPSLEFVSPNTFGGNSGVSGNLDENRRALGPVQIEATIPDGHHFVMRWYQDRSSSDGNPDSGAYHALGVDRMSVAVMSGPVNRNIWQDLPSVNGWRDTGPVWVFDAEFPYVYDFRLGWLYCYPVSTIDNLYFHHLETDTPVWVYPSWDYYYDFRIATWVAVD
jgi:hypothetical protein